MTSSTRQRSWQAGQARDFVRTDRCRIREGEAHVENNLVNDPNPNMSADAAMTSEAMMKIDAALANEDQDGVAVPKVKEAKAALEAGKFEQARTLLQASIAQALAQLKPATGEETGTSLVVPPLSHPELTGRDWVFLVLSVLLAVIGTVLGFLFRPRLKLANLRRMPSKGSTL
jgi:hypothetical protein